MFNRCLCYFLFIYLLIILKILTVNLIAADKKRRGKDTIFNHFVSSILIIYFYLFIFSLCLQCFDAVGWAAGRASGL